MLWNYLFWGIIWINTRQLAEQQFNIICLQIQRRRINFKKALRDLVHLLYQIYNQWKHGLPAYPATQANFCKKSKQSWDTGMR